jgi:hypothetical protein
MTTGLLLFSGLAHAQQAAQTAEGTVPFFAGGAFFVSLLVGFILAAAFEMTLTALSIAAGVSALKPAGRKPAGKEKPRDSGESSAWETARTFSTAYGAWMLVSQCLSLFFACWLAVKLSLSTSHFIGGVLGLGIWGFYSLAMTAMEMSALSSLAGSVKDAAMAGMRSIKDAAAGAFSRSSEKQAAKSAESVVSAVREEFLGGGDFRKQLQKFVRELRPEPVDPSQIREELGRLFNDAEIRSMTVHDDKLDRDKLVYSLHLKYGTGERMAEAAQGVKGAATAVKEEVQSDKPAVEKAIDAGLRAAGASKEDAEGTRRKWEEYLRSTGKEALNPDEIKKELERLFTDPQGTFSALRTRAAELFNRSTLTSILTARKDLSPEDAERAADWIDHTIQAIRQRGESAQGTLAGFQQGALAKVRDYLNGLNRPELKYEGLRDALTRLFHDPKAGMEDLMHRVKSMDRETLKAIISSRKDTTPEDAEHLLNEIEGTRDRMVNRVESMKQEVERRLAKAKEEALHQADEARKTAATAAWWAFITAVGSGAAAVAGALTAIR